MGLADQSSRPTALIVSCLQTLAAEVHPHTLKELCDAYLDAVHGDGINVAGDIHNVLKADVRLDYVNYQDSNKFLQLKWTSTANEVCYTSLLPSHTRCRSFPVLGCCSDMTSTLQRRS
mmetsp:Transcript_23597/g.51232  ORF Transcript_23597/g.51232 Transcript_23597/m.51232 type:complete len:118 (+) Transcript_23597:31-384(+)